jgi:hypothetical protein
VAGSRQKEFEMQFKFAGETLTVKFDSYTDGSLAVLAVDAEGAPYAVLSVNIPGHSNLLDPNMFYLKDYSENKAIAAAFVEQCELYPTPRTAMAGYVTVQAFAVRNSLALNF